MTGEELKVQMRKRKVTVQALATELKVKPFVVTKARKEGPDRIWNCRCTSELVQAALLKLGRREAPAGLKQPVIVAYGGGVNSTAMLVGMVERGERPDAYSKAYRSRFGGARYRNAGVRVEYPEGRPVAIIETARGTEVARLPLPMKGERAGWTTRGLLDGDLYALPVRSHGTIRAWQRYGAGKRKDGLVQVMPTGLVVSFPVPEDCRQQGRSRWGIFRTTEATYLEHGATFAHCVAEYRRKLKLAQEDREASAASERLTRLAARIARGCPGLVVTHEDRRKAGYCDLGTAAFAERYGLEGRETVTAQELRATGDSRVEAPIREAALRVARQVLAAGRTDRVAVAC